MDYRRGAGNLFPFGFLLSTLHYNVWTFILEEQPLYLCSYSCHFTAAYMAIKYTNNCKTVKLWFIQTAKEKQTNEEPQKDLRRNTCVLSRDQNWIGSVSCFDVMLQSHSWYLKAVCQQAGSLHKQGLSRKAFSPHLHLFFLAPFCSYVH